MYHACLKPHLGLLSIFSNLCKRGVKNSYIKNRKIFYCIEIYLLTKYIVLPSEVRVIKLGKEALETPNINVADIVIKHVKELVLRRRCLN
jgi:hypothetical protein